MRSLLPFLPVLLATLAATPAWSLDEAAYAAMLERHTVDVPDVARTRVDYGALRGSAAWRGVVASLDTSDPSRLRTRGERIAFWSNAYNILAIDVVVVNDPPDSIRDIGSFWSPVWKREAGRIAGRAYTLHEIEHEILRPMGDPRIHAAIVCASTSCPSLRREPYTVGRIDAQLDDAMRRFLADPDKGMRIERATRTVHLSSIFDWFAADFEAPGGVLAYVAQRAPEADRSWLAANADARIEYLDYDWQLNDTARRRD